MPDSIKIIRVAWRHGQTPGAEINRLAIRLNDQLVAVKLGFLIWATRRKKPLNLGASFSFRSLIQIRRVHPMRAFK